MLCFLVFILWCFLEFRLLSLSRVTVISPCSVVLLLNILAVTWKFPSNPFGCIFLVVSQIMEYFDLVCFEGLDFATLITSN